MQVQHLLQVTPPSLTAHVLIPAVQLITDGTDRSPPLPVTRQDTIRDLADGRHLHHKPNLLAGAAAPSVAPGSCLSTTKTSLPQVSVPWSSLGLGIESPDLPLNDSLIAKAVSGDEPEQIHLAIGASVAEMYVMWLTGKPPARPRL